jgi:Xaa-Pro aminopeptidase
MFLPDIYIERRKKLKEQVGSGLMLFLGNDESPMNYPDNTYPFRQDSTFLYFFGLDYPSLAAVIDADQGTETVFGDDISVDDIVWMGPQPSLCEKSEKIGISDTAALNQLANTIKTALQQNRKIHFLPPYRPENVLKLQQLLHLTPDEAKARVSPDFIKAVVAQRSIKTAEEIEQIESALAIAHEMQTTAMKISRPGMYERQIAGAMEGIALSHGGSLSFPTIFSIHGETLHNHYHGNLMLAGDIAVNDSGAETALHYASDITRTVPISGKFTDRQKDIYSIVLESQEKAIAAIKAGVEFRRIHFLACAIVTDGLKNLGLMKGNTDEAVQAGAHAMFFPCGTGHMMGLDVHDMENLGEDYVGYTDTIKRNPLFGWKSLRLGKKIEPDYVVTVEPGIYFIPELIDQWQAEKKHVEFINYDVVNKYRDFGGVRLEDDILVLPEGYRILGPAIPKTIAEVEEICST